MRCLNSRPPLCERTTQTSTSSNFLPRPSHSRVPPIVQTGKQCRRYLAQDERRSTFIARATETDNEDDDEPPRRRGGRGRRPPTPPEDEGPQRDAEGFEERLLQVSRVTKVVKGGKQMSFRAVVAVGDDKGRVGVGTSSAKEVVQAVEKAAIDAKRHVISIPITRGFSFPHRVNGIAGGAKVMLRPASEGTGVIAGGAVREILELAGIKNGFGKQLGSDNPLNNARATVDGLSQLRTLQQVAKDRNLTVEQMLGFNKDSLEEKKEAVATA